MSAAQTPKSCAICRAKRRYRPCLPAAGAACGLPVEPLFGHQQEHVLVGKYFLGLYVQRIAGQDGKAPGLEHGRAAQADLLATLERQAAANGD